MDPVSHVTHTMDPVSHVTHYAIHSCHCQSYYDAMDPENNTSMPLRLRDKRHVVFGNLPEIHKFHET